MDKLVDEIAPRVRATDCVKAELLQMARKFLQSTLSLGRGGEEMGESGGVVLLHLNQVLFFMRDS